VPAEPAVVWPGTVPRSTRVVNISSESRGGEACALVLLRINIYEEIKFAVVAELITRARNVYGTLPGTVLYVHALVGCQLDDERLQSVLTEEYVELTSAITEYRHRAVVTTAVTITATDVSVERGNVVGVAPAKL